ncbi:MAG: T9SS type A sorting domain-containing protein [Flavobacteriales bacterium]|nr:T9SS type A sorting domain-containing protein [Flavobacteriales bacterium]
MRRKLHLAICALFLAPMAHGQFSAIQPIEYTGHSLFMDNEPSVIVDLDGDGDLDMASGSDEGVGMWRNDGQGSYAPVILIDGSSFSGYATFIEAADFDQDGDADLLVAENYTRLLLYTNNGNASFQPANVLMPALGDLRDLVVAELTGDNYPDVLQSDYWGDSLWVMPNVGGTTLGPRITVSTGIGSITDLHVDDLDADGDLDVLFSSYSVEGCHWSEQTSPGVFAAPVMLFPFDVEILGMSTADLDGDGDLDILAGGFKRSFWYANDGAVQFGPADTLQFTTTSATYYGHVVADLDGDGDLDVVPHEYSLSHPDLFVNDGAGNFTNAGPLVGGEVYQLAAADLDGDADADLVQTTRNAIWWANDGAGNLGGSTFLAGGLTTPSSVAVADLNGDGIKDVLATGYPGRLAVWWGLGGGGAFSGQVVLLDTLDNPKDLVVGDLDGDGDIDVTIIQTKVIRTFLNTGNGSLVVGQTVINNTSTITGAQLGDVDGDGDLDLMTAEYNPSQVRRWTNSGSGTFLNPTQIAVVSSPDDVDLCDVDGDGDLDAVFSHGGSPSQFVWMPNNGGGQFGTPQVFFTSTSNGGNSSAVAFDANGDGVPELVSASWEGVWIFQGMGGGAFSAGTAIDPWYVDETDLFAVDLDSDGDVDLAFADKSGNPARYSLNDGAGAFSAPSPFDASYVGDQASELVVSDADGDGDPDAVVANMNTSPFSVGWSENFFNSPYHIDGAVFHDADADGVRDPGELPLPFVQVGVAPVASVAITDPSGAYTVPCDTGLYEVSVILPNAWWGLTTDSATYHPNITSLNPVSVGNDFGFDVVLDTNLLAASVVGSQWPCGDTTVVWVNVMNLGTTDPSGTLCVSLDTLYTFINSVPPPISISGNTYCWAYDSLGYYSQTSIAVELVLPSPTSMGAPFSNAVVAVVEDALGVPVDSFAYAWSGLVTCSYDPNDKQVSPAGYGEAGAVELSTTHLDYTIRFQNTGSAAAIDVVLNDRLHEGLDLSTFQVLGHSHTPTQIIIGADRELVVRFDGIQLPDSGSSFTASQGFFRFGIDLVNGQPHLTEITNTASIFFDLNPAVVTNTTRTTLVDCALWEPVITASGWQALVATEGDAYQWYLDGLPVPGATAQLFFPTTNGSCTVEVTSAFGCVSLSDPFQLTTVGIEEQHKLGIAVVPNPVTDQARLVFSEVLTPGHVLEVIDLQGRVLRTMNGYGSDQVLLDRTGLASGLYVVRVNKEGVMQGSIRFAVQ